MGKVIFGKWGTTPGNRNLQAKDTGGREKVYQLRISLPESDPEIWRRFLISGNTTLAKLHKVIQAVMGWTDSHLHEFAVRDITFGDPDPEMKAEGMRNEKKAFLYQIAPGVRASFMYIYDFGDDWIHRITVEKITDDHEKFSGKPVCLEGERACPPEDCGGIPGYYDLLEIIKDPGDPEYEEIMDWLGGSFDPDRLDIKKINSALQKIR